MNDALTTALQLQAMTTDDFDEQPTQMIIEVLTATVRP